MSLNLMGLQLVRLPAELEERRATDDASIHLVMNILSVADDPFQSSLLSHFHQVLVVSIQEYQSVMGFQEVI